MPFGKTVLPSVSTVDFDAVYRELIAPAIAAAGMVSLRANAEVTGGGVLKPMSSALSSAISPSPISPAPTPTSSTPRAWVRCLALCVHSVNGIEVLAQQDGVLPLSQHSIADSESPVWTVVQGVRKE